MWEDFKKILRLVADPERRANLHLRHLRSRPRIWTPCCHREHCFRCRTKVVLLQIVMDTNSYELKNALDYNHYSYPSDRIILQLELQDFHDRKSCDENTSSLDQTIISCPSCNIAIAKGDGCNTVFCVCGKQFSWEAEKESLQRSSAFVALYASDTSEASAQVICCLLFLCLTLFLDLSCHVMFARHRILLYYALLLSAPFFNSITTVLHAMASKVI